jgi:hypothetical protein
MDMDIDEKFHRLNDLNGETMSISSTRKIIEWSYENEEILSEWCDIAQCYKWLNTETYKYYRDLTSTLTIPCIVFSTISGAVSFGIPNIPEEYQYLIPLIIGTITISIGIITTIQQYYRFTELKEKHRTLAGGWDKLARSIRIELSKAPTERIDARHYIKFTRIEFDNLMENTDIIPGFIINKFNLMVDDEYVKNKKLNRTGDRNSLKKPDICDAVISINENRRIWFPSPLNLDEEISCYSVPHKYKRKKYSKPNNKPPNVKLKNIHSFSDGQTTPVEDTTYDFVINEQRYRRTNDFGENNVGYNVKMPYLITTTNANVENINDDDNLPI